MVSLTVLNPISRAHSCPANEKPTAAAQAVIIYGIWHPVDVARSGQDDPVLTRHWLGYPATFHWLVGGGDEKLPSRSNF